LKTKEKKPKRTNNLEVARYSTVATLTKHEKKKKSRLRDGKIPVCQGGKPLAPLIPAYCRTYPAAAARAGGLRCPGDRRPRGRRASLWKRQHYHQLTSRRGTRSAALLQSSDLGRTAWCSKKKSIITV